MSSLRMRIVHNMSTQTRRRATTDTPLVREFYEFYYEFYDLDCTRLMLPFYCYLLWPTGDGWGGRTDRQQF